MTSRIILSVLLALLVAGSQLGCGSTSGTRPHDMSVAGHHEAATGDELQAEEYETRATLPDDATDPGRALALAALYRRHAEAHHAAAQKLESSSNPDACVGVEARHQESCPLAEHTPVALEETADGITLTFAGIEHAAIESHVRCHLAHAELMGDHDQAAASCPLLGADLEIHFDTAGDDTLMILRGQTPAAAERVKGIYSSGATTL